MTTAPVTEPAQPSTRGRGRRRTLGVVAGVALVAVGVLAWEWRHPGLFDSEVPSDWGTRARMEVGETFNVRMTYDDLGPGPHAITIHDVKPAIARNTAGARIEFWRCTEKGDVGFANIDGDPRRHCTDLVPAAGNDLTLHLRPAQHVTMSITPTQPGVVRVRGMHLTYSDGWRTGTQTTGEHVLLRVR